MEAPFDGLLATVKSIYSFVIYIAAIFTKFVDKGGLLKVYLNVLHAIPQWISPYSKSWISPCTTFSSKSPLSKGASSPSHWNFANLERISFIFANSLANFRHLCQNRLFSWGLFFAISFRYSQPLGKFDVRFTILVRFALLRGKYRPKSTFCGTSSKFEFRSFLAHR